MTAFQWIGIGLAASFLVLTIAAVARHRLSKISAAAWSLLWVAAGVAIYDPSLTQTVAAGLGISRGADLVFYCAILAMFVGFFLVFAKLRRVEEHLTTLVREIAVSRPGRPDRDPSDG